MGNVVVKQQSCSFPGPKDLCNAESAEDLGQYKEKFSSLIHQFTWCFQAFDELEAEFKIFCSPFSVTLFDVPTDMQLEITDL